jgi:hypothetical protein
LVSVNHSASYISSQIKTPLDKESVKILNLTSNDNFYLNEIKLPWNFQRPLPLQQLLSIARIIDEWLSSNIEHKAVLHIKANDVIE